MNGIIVEYKFQIVNGDLIFVDVVVEGEKSVGIKLIVKKIGVYYCSYELKLFKSGCVYKVCVVCIIDDNSSQYFYNDIWVDLIGEIVDILMNYLNFVLVGLKVNFEQFGSIMLFCLYLVCGLKICVLLNYNEVSNIYDGVWDGIFKLLFFLNFVWIFFDLFINV